MFSLPTPEAFNVLPGMTANIRIDLSKVTDLNFDNHMLPVGAVFAAEDAPLESSIRFIWKLDPQTMKVSRAEVSVGEIRQQRIEILSGVAPGDQVVSVGVHFLTEGMQIRPWTREEGL